MVIVSPWTLWLVAVRDTNAPVCLARRAVHMALAIEASTAAMPGVRLHVCHDVSDEDWVPRMMSRQPVGDLLQLLVSKRCLPCAMSMPQGSGYRSLPSEPAPLGIC